MNENFNNSTFSCAHLGSWQFWWARRQDYREAMEESWKVNNIKTNPEESCFVPT